MSSPAAAALVGPVGFVAVIGAVSLFVGGRAARRDGQVDPDQVAAEVSGRMAAILFVVQAGLAAVAWTLWRAGAVVSTPATVGAVAVGVAVGVAVFVVYVGAVERLMVAAQTRFGDYVPAGTVVDRLTRPLSLFFVANVALAPVAEEVIYRGFLIPRLAAGWGWWVAVVVVSVAFGLLHWPAGLWYMAATALFVGLPFGVLYVWSQSVVVPVAAHLVLNVCEFVLGGVRARRSQGR